MGEEETHNTIGDYNARKAEAENYKKDTEEPHTHCLVTVYLKYVQLSHAHHQCSLFLFTSLQQL